VAFKTSTVPVRNWRPRVKAALCDAPRMATQGHRRNMRCITLYTHDHEYTTSDRGVGRLATTPRTTES
jgi:hypothetical protein